MECHRQIDRAWVNFRSLAFCWLLWPIFVHFFEQHWRTRVNKWLCCHNTWKIIVLVLKKGERLKYWEELHFRFFCWNSVIFTNIDNVWVLAVQAARWRHVEILTTLITHKGQMITRRLIELFSKFVEKAIYCFMNHIEHLQRQAKMILLNL